MLPTTTSALSNISDLDAASKSSNPFDVTLEDLKELNTKALAGKISDLEAALQLSRDPFEKELDRWITTDAKMLAVKEMIRSIKFSGTRSPVLITGPTGTGKEVLARALTVNGAPFIAQNCGGFLNKELLPSLLFGHLKGSFTGADRDKSGVLTEAKNGIIFLDEVGDLPGELQAAFLRAIQEAEIYPVGAVRPLKIQCQFIAATNYNLAERVEKGYFRSDLYARLRTFEIHITGLEQRTGDIPLIASHYGWEQPIPDFMLPEIYSENVRAIQRYIERMKVIGYYDPAHKMLLEQEEKNQLFES